LKRIRNNEYPQNKEELYINGDGKVTSKSNLLLPLKWAKNFENKTEDGVENPVLFAE